MKTIAHFNNLNVRIQALGLAHTLEKEAVYLSTAGPSVACKSIWATLVSGKARLSCRPWIYQTLRGKKGIKSVYQPLPQSNFLHMVCLNGRPNLILVAEPQAADLTTFEHVEERQALLDNQMSTVIKRFVAYLNAETDAPVWPTWGEALWDAGLEQTIDEKSGIQPLDTYGDCLGAWEINPEFPWIQLIQELMQTGEIEFPEESMSVSQ